MIDAIRKRDRKWVDKQNGSNAGQAARDRRWLLAQVLTIESERRQHARWYKAAKRDRDRLLKETERARLAERRAFTWQQALEDARR